MAVYQYRKKGRAKGCDTCNRGFEVLQQMRDAPLAECPHCGARVERIVSLCSISTRQSDKAKTSDTNLKRHGFTKLVNEGEGKFRKAF